MELSRKEGIIHGISKGLFMDFEPPMQNPLCFCSPSMRTRPSWRWWGTGAQLA